MTTEVQILRGELSDRIAALESRYRSTSPDQRDLVFVSNALEEWLRYRGRLEKLWGGDANRQIRKQQRFLSQVREDFYKGMDTLIEEYDTSPNKDVGCILQTIESSRKCLQLYVQAGLHSIRVRGEKNRVEKEKRGGYGEFLQRLKTDLGIMETPPTSLSNPPQNYHIDNFQRRYEGIVTINGGVGTSYPFHFAILTDHEGNVYWMARKSIGALLPDDVYSSLGKKIDKLVPDDVVLALAFAWARESKVRGIQIHEDLELLAAQIFVREPKLPKEIYKRVRN